MLNAPYAGITRIRLKGSTAVVSAAFAAPLYWIVFLALNTLIISPMILFVKREDISWWRDKFEFIVLCKTFFEKKVLHSKKLSNWQREPTAKGSAKEKDVKNELVHFWRLFLADKAHSAAVLCTATFCLQTLYISIVWKFLWGRGGLFPKSPPHNNSYSNSNLFMGQKKLLRCWNAKMMVDTKKECLPSFFVLR